MEKELIGPTATLAAALLSKVENEHSEFTRDIITSAFEEAYFALQEGMRRVDKEVHRLSGRPPTRGLDDIQKELDASGKP